MEGVHKHGDSGSIQLQAFIRVSYYVLSPVPAKELDDELGRDVRH